MDFTEFEKELAERVLRYYPEDDFEIESDPYSTC
jgi:hypothetical protein